jgi:hypothetical protein
MRNMLLEHRVVWRKASSSFCYLIHAGFLLGLIFAPEDGGYMFLRNISWLSTDYVALYYKNKLHKHCCGNTKSYGMLLYARMNYITNLIFSLFPKYILKTGRYFAEDRTVYWLYDISWPRTTIQTRLWSEREAALPVPTIFLWLAILQQYEYRLLLASRVSAVGLTIGYTIGRPRGKSSNSVQLRPDLGPTQSSIKWVPGAVSLTVKAAGVRSWPLISN